jgi:hypothetical protein
MPYIVTHIKTTGKHTTEIHDHEPKLDRLQKMVDGEFELVRSVVGQLYVNEEGRCERLTINAFASVLAGQPIVGDAVHVMKV